MPFGKGARACIAQNLATVTLTYATERVVRSGVLEGAEAVGELKIKELFNAKVIGEKVEICFPNMDRSKGIRERPGGREIRAIDER